jgi:tRNA(fMet)-specific endonuclease VapC
MSKYDLLIASQARALDLILLRHNLREFERVPGLRLEGWLDLTPAVPEGNA